MSTRRGRRPNGVSRSTCGNATQARQHVHVAALAGNQTFAHACNQRSTT
jgi:hypothetical protein